jgi:hypothetical protein
MSSFITTENEILSFQEYCLLESVAPKETPYGTNDDADDRVIAHDRASSFITFFKSNDLTYAVLVNKYSDGFEVGFGASDVKDSFIKNLRAFTDKRTNVLSGGLAAQTFSKVFYVLVEMVEKGRWACPLYFSEADPRLGTLYDNLVKNKFFLEELGKLGYTYEGKENKHHKFVRNEILSSH